MSLSEQIAAKRAAAARGQRGGRVATGGVAGREAGAQHVDMFRKVMLRKRLLRSALPGPVYVPFIGEGDIAAELYSDREIWGADLSDERIDVARKVLAKCKGNLVVGDCDRWPFDAARPTKPFAVADFDAYSYPYDSFRAFLDNAPLARRMILVFTDGMRMGILRSTAKQWHHPAGHMVDKGDTNSKRRQWSSYWARILLPWFREAMDERGYTVVRTSYYIRGAGLLYWVAHVEKK